jgi:putative methyltransferase (TIGR04325 family)
MDAARSAIRHYRPETRSHLERRLISSNFALSSEIRMSDYPVLFWLRNIAAEENLRIFDFGGGVGQTYANFSRLLPPEKLESWTCHDLPEVILQAGENYFPEGVPECLHFTTDLGENDGCNVFLAAGALHYWEFPMAQLLREFGSRPRHFLINRSPMRITGKPFATVQEGVDWAVACMVRSLPDLKSEMESEGYTLVDHWVDLEKSLAFPWLPDWSCPYLGLYFRRNIHESNLH